MVQHQSFPCTNETQRRSDYWKLVPPHRFAGNTSKELKLVIDSLVIGNRPYTSSTNMARLRELAYRAQRRLRCYDGDSKSLLKTFCSQRRLPIDLRGACKPDLVWALERADDEAIFHRFLDLPPEVRVIIYGMYCDNFEFAAGSTDEVAPRRELVHPVAPPITQVCSIIRRESLPCFYQCASFAFELKRVPSRRLIKRASRGFATWSPGRFLQTLPSSSIAMIRYISIRANFTSPPAHGAVRYDSAVTIDVGAGQEEPKAIHFQRAKASSATAIKRHPELDLRLESKVKQALQAMSGRREDKKLGDYDIETLVMIYKKYQPYHMYKR